MSKKGETIPRRCIVIVIGIKVNRYRRLVVDRSWSHVAVVVGVAIVAHSSSRTFTAVVDVAMHNR